MKTPPDPDAPLAAAVARDVERVREEIHRLVRLANIGHAEIEAKNGWNKGYLRLLLSGSVSLTLRHLYGILGALGVSIDRFYEHLERQR